MTKNNRKDAEWMQNPNQLKNPKVYSIMALRNPDGSFHLIGGQQKVLIKKNQYKVEWVNVDTRDMAKILRSSKIKAL